MILAAITEERTSPNKAFQRTPNTPRRAANAFGILSQQSAPRSAQLNWALDDKRGSRLVMYPPDVIETLKDCLRTIYWYKRQLRSFLENCRVPLEITAAQSWNDPQEYKAFIADKVVNALVEGGDKHLGAFRELIRRVTEMDDFSHLLKEEEGRRLKREAEVNVERLRQLIGKHTAEIKKEEEKRKAREQAAEK